MENNNLIHFKTRFDIPLYEAIIKLSKNLKIPVYRLVQKALIKLLNDYKEGHKNFNHLSDFLQRKNLKKKEYYAIFDYKSKERLRRLAFTFYKSQAEVLRIALEYYVYVVHCSCGKNICEIYKQKNHHRTFKPVIGLVIYELFTVKTTQILILKKTKPHKSHFY